MYSGDEQCGDEITSGVTPRERAHAKARELRAWSVLEQVRGRFGFLTAAELAIIAADPLYRATTVIVRCGGCRFIAAADQAAHLMAIIGREGSEYVRDVSVYNAQGQS